MGFKIPFQWELKENFLGRGINLKHPCPKVGTSKGTLVTRKRTFPLSFGFPGLYPELAEV